MPSHWPKPLKESDHDQKIKVADLPDFDMAEHLDSDEAIAQYLSIVLEENDPAELAHALGTIARARGMTEVARASFTSARGTVQGAAPHIAAAATPS